MKRAIAVLILGFAVVACGGDDTDRPPGEDASYEDWLAYADEHARPCEEVFADGRSTDEAVAENEESACTEDGELSLVTSAVYECSAAVDVSWWYNDYGFGVEGEQWHRASDFQPQYNDAGDFVDAEGNVIC